MVTENTHDHLLPKFMSQPKPIRGRILAKGQAGRASSRKGVDNSNAGLLKISAVARGDGKIINESSRPDEAVFDRHRTAS